jgi:hypothetical protein
MRMTGGRWARLGLVLALWSATALTLAGASSATAPSLTAKAVFTKAAYVSGDTITVKITVHNSGASTVRGITAYASSDPSSLALVYPAFGKLGTGATIPAGGHVTVTVAGHLADPGASSVTFSGGVTDREGNGLADFAASAPVTVRHRTVHGRVFKDKNANGRRDTGEALKGAKISLGYLYGDRSYQATTGPAGRFSVVVPWGQYYVSGGTAAWKVIPRVARVRAHSAPLALRAVRPLAKVLKAAIHFTESRYKVHARAHVVIKLTNTGSRLLRGIVPACARAGDPDELQNTGRGWGRLAVDGPGVTIAAHSTRTFTVTARVPSAAQRAGQVVVACDFGYPGVETGYRPTAIDSARVPGQFGAFAVYVFSLPHGASGPMVGRPGVRVVLADATRCPVYRRTATTDATGHLRIGHLPAGASYRLYLFPPKGWKVRGKNPTPAFVYGKDTIRFSILAVPGSKPAPTVPRKCA